MTLKRSFESNALAGSWSACAFLWFSFWDVKGSFLRGREKIDKVMTDFLHRGDMVDAAVKSMEIGKLDTIASIEANYRYEKSAILEQTSLKEKITYSNSRSPETSLLAKIENPLNHIKTLIEELTNIIKESEIEPSRFKKPIQELFSEYRDSPTENDLRDNHRIRMTEWIETELLKKLSSICKKQNGFSILS